MQKRGNIWNSKESSIAISKLLLFLFEAVLFASVYLFLLAQVSALKNDITYEELYISRDLAFLLDVLYAAPGTISYEYANDKPILRRFIYNFKQQVVELNWEGARSSYRYAEDTTIETKTDEIAYTDKLILEKDNKQLTIKDVK